MLTGPCRAISTSGSFSIETADDDGAGDDAVSKLHWDCYDAGNHDAFRRPITQAIRTGRGDIDVTYAVLSSAVEASVEVKLLPTRYGAANPADILVHGSITARSRDFDVESVLLDQSSDQKVVVAGPDNRLPLARFIVAVPLDCPLVTRAKLQACNQAGADFTPIDYSFPLDPMRCAETEERLVDYDGIQVQVTWSLDFA